MLGVVRGGTGALSRVRAFPAAALSNVFFAAILLVALERFSEDVDIRADLAHLQEQPSNDGPERALEYARRGSLGDAVCSRRVHRVTAAARVGADGGGISRSFGAFGL